MKPLCFLVFTLLLSFHSSFAQNIYFPDPNFKQALIDAGVDTGNDVEISVAEAQVVTYLNVSIKSISDLSGIEYFTSLEFLGCSDNSLTSLDLSELSSLEFLDCSDNSLTSLNLSELSSLEVLYCYNNSLTRLDVSNLSNLQVLGCYNNSLTSLDVSDLSSLQVLPCFNNSLTSLDVSNLSNLQLLDCSHNSLTSLDVSKLSSLEDLDCSDNYLTSLDVSNLSNLDELDCSGNSLINVDLRNTPNLIVLAAQDNPDLQCLIVDDPNNPPVFQLLILDQNPIPYTSETCLANFDAMKVLVDGMVSHSSTSTILLATLCLAEDGCTHVSKWKAISSLEAFILMVLRTRQLGRLTPFEAELLTSNARKLIRNIRSGDVACNGQPRNIPDWFSQRFDNNLENPVDADAYNTLQTTSYTEQYIYPNPTSGRVNFSQSDQLVVVYNMLGKVIEKADGVDHIDMSEYQPGVYVIQLSKDKERTVHQVVKE